MKKNVLLINVHNPEVYGNAEVSLHPLGLLYIGSYLLYKGFNVKIIDYQIVKFKEEDLLKEIRESEPLCIGFTVLTPQIEIVYKLCGIIRKNFAKALIVLGGHHITALKEKILIENENIDFILTGEAEISMYRLCLFLADKQDTFSLDSIAGLGYRKDNAVKYNNNIEPIENLDDLPEIEYSIINVDKYIPSIKWATHSKFITMMTSRGCPFKCNFCSAHLTFGRKVRFRSIDKVISDIEKCYTRNKIEYVIFYDDTFSVNRARILEFCSKLLSKKILIKWGCLSRVDCVDEELLKVMKEAGCSMLSFGVESGSENVLRKINKGITLQKIRDAFFLTRKLGIETTASMIIGLPEETIEDIYQTINFVLEINPTFLQIARAVPYPGTDLYNNLLNLKQINENISFSQYHEYSNYPLFKNDNISEEVLVELSKKLYREFYLRPGKIFEIAARLKNPYILKRYIKSAWSFIKLI